MIKQLINRFKVKTTKLGRIVHTGRVANKSSARPLRKQRTLRPRLKPRFLR